MKHWWERTAREQKHLRRWAREPLATNLAAKADARLDRERARVRAVRARRRIWTCGACHGSGLVYRVLTNLDGSKEYQSVPCPICVGTA